MTSNKKLMTGGALAVLAVLFVAVILICNTLFRGAQVDLTQNHLYTLSSGTRNILADIDEPIHLYLFWSDKETHGILLQLPVPKHLDMPRLIESISVEKDVDGFHLYNAGGLIIGNTAFPPCTPFGVTKLLEHEGIELEGKNVVVVGASNIVGKPMALMLMQREATVCICHAKTRDLAQFTILADILVVAAGKPNLIVPQMVKTGAVVIDVGINRLPDGKLVGDVDFAGVSQKASLITPVPGGVGPMTITMLLANTIGSAERRLAGANRSAA